MKKQTYLVLCVLFLLSLAACLENVSPTSVRPFSTSRLTPARPPSSPTHLIPSPTPPPSRTVTPTPLKTATLTKTPTASQTVTATVPPETRLKFECLDVLPNLQAGATSADRMSLNAIVRNDTGTFLLNMVTNQSVQIAEAGENLGEFMISPDTKNLAFASTSLASDGSIDQRYMVIVDANGQRQKVVPWEEKWFGILAWTNDNRLLLSYDDPDLKASGKQSTLFAYLVFDPFSGEQEILLPNFPEYIHDAKIPFWDGWFGAVYDPTLTRVIYPHTMQTPDGFFTFALWDLSKRSIVASLEKVYHELMSLSIAASMPVWSPDGSQVAFIGHGIDINQPEFELYRVSRDGQVEQLTHLSSISLLRGMTFSWSPDGGKIAMLMDSGVGVSHVSVLDVETKDVTDYCIPIKMGMGGEEFYPPIWSPDGQQFLVIDWAEDGHSRIILVDIDQNFAAQIAENVEPLGWMVAP